MVGLREVQLGKTMNSHQSSRENTKKNLKTVLKTKNTRFLRLNIARTLKEKKNFLSFFHDWKFYSRESREISRENLWVPLQQEPPPQISLQSKPRETLKTQNLKNILNIFHDWDIDIPVSHEKSLCGLVTRACNWTNPRLSRQNKATQFLKILTIFAKTKYFPKTFKTLKNLFVFDQQRLSLWKHI